MDVIQKLCTIKKNKKNKNISSWSCMVHAEYPITVLQSVAGQAMILHQELSGGWPARTNPDESVP